MTKKSARADSHTARGWVYAAELAGKLKKWRAATHASNRVSRVPDDDRAAAADRDAGRELKGRHDARKPRELVAIPTTLEPEDLD